MLDFVVSEAEAGERVDVVASRRAGLPRAAVREALRSGAVTVSGAPVRPSHRLRAGEVVAGDAATHEPAPPAEDAVPLAVRHSDERVLVVSKPAGLVTHPGAGHRTGTLVNALLGLGVPLAAEGSERPGIVHRLDKDTSGLLLVAKDDGAHAFLTAALRARRVERHYLALVGGAMPAPRGTIQAPLGRHPTRPRRRAVVADGRPATTHYETIAATDRVSLLEVTLESGRTHQIRVHLSHLGHPVLGDRVYGGASKAAAELGLERPFLHAHRLSWPDPGDGRPRTAVDELPAELRHALARAGLPAPPARP